MNQKTKRKYCKLKAIFQRDLLRSILLHEDLAETRDFHSNGGQLPIIDLALNLLPKSD